MVYYEPDERRHLPNSTALKALRNAKGMTLSELSERTRIDIGSLSRIERGQRDPTVSTARRIAVALGLDRVNGVLAVFEPNGEG